MLDTSSIADQNFTNSQFDHMEDKFGWMSRNYPTCLMLPFKKENEGNLQLSGAAGLYCSLASDSKTRKGALLCTTSL